MRTRARRGARGPSVLVVLGSLVFVAIGCASAPERDVPVGRSERSWSDPARPRWRGQGDRPIAATLWYPAREGSQESETRLGPPGLPLLRQGWAAAEAPPRDGGRRPLVVLSHGTGSSASDLSWLAEPLVAAGYVVLGVTHHGNSIAAGDLAIQGFYLWWERSRDLTVAIDRLADDPEFGDRVDFERTGAAGFSIGGHSVLLLAGARIDLDAYRRSCEGPDAIAANCDPPPEALSLADEAIDWTEPRTVASLARSGLDYRDPRVRAVYSLAPAVATAITADSLADIELPVRVVVGEDDRMAPLDPNALHVASHAPGARLWRLPGVDHYSFLSVCTRLGSWLLGDICGDGNAVARRALHERVADDAVAFFGETLSPRAGR